MKLKPIVISTMLAPSLLGFAAQGHAQCTGIACRNVTLDRVYAAHDGDVLVGTSGQELNLNCAPDATIYLTLADSHPNKDEIYAMILASRLENKPIWIRTTGVSPEPCAIAYTVLRD